MEFELLNIAGVLLSNYAVADTVAMKSFYNTVYSKTKHFYLSRTRKVFREKS